MKAILVIDMPNECDGCPCLNYKMWYCQADKKHRDGGDDDIPEWCPLKPMPQKKKLDEDLLLSQNFKLEYARFDGYNKCIDEILGEE